jgi:hypothetical protein
MFLKLNLCPSSGEVKKTNIICGPLERDNLYHSTEFRNPGILTGMFYVDLYKGFADVVIN